MNTKRAIYPGSFDPITNGHLDTGHKDPLFTPDERVELIREVVKGRKNVKVDRWPGLIMEYAAEHKLNAVIRGLRAASDFEYEFMMASMNKTIQPDVETLFMMTGQNLFFVSSSMIKELFRYGGDISPYVPELVVKRLKDKINK